MPIYEYLYYTSRSANTSFEHLAKSMAASGEKGRMPQVRVEEDGAEAIGVRHQGRQARGPRGEVRGTGTAVRVVAAGSHGVRAAWG